MVGNLVTHDLHDVVAVSDETDRDGGRQDGKLPDRNGCLGSRRVTRVPCAKNNGPRSDRVADIVGTMRKRCRASR